MSIKHDYKDLTPSVTAKPAPADKADPSTWVFSDAQAIAFMSTLCRNIDDKKLSDTDFR